MSRVYPFSDDVYGDTVYAACTDISSSNNCSCSSSSSSSNISSSGSTLASSTTHVSGFNEHNGSVWNQDDLLRPYTHPEYGLDDMIDTLDVKGLEPPQDFPLLSEGPLMARCWEVCQNQTMCDDQILDVQGRLKTAITFWVDTLHVSSPVLDWVQEGYKLPLIALSQLPVNLTISRQLIMNSLLLKLWQSSWHIVASRRCMQNLTYVALCQWSLMMEARNG